MLMCFTIGAFAREEFAFCIAYYITVYCLVIFKTPVTQLGGIKCPIGLWMDRHSSIVYNLVSTHHFINAYEKILINFDYAHMKIHWKGIV
jgi:hypothetical protein